jgi:membrane protein
LGFQTVFSLIPALVLALFLVRSLGGLGNLSQDVARFIFHQFNLDEIELRLRSGEPAPQQPTGSPDSSDPPGEGTEPAPPKDAIAQAGGNPPPATEGVATPRARRGPPPERLSDKIQKLVDGVDEKLRSKPVNIVSLFWFIVAAMSLALTLEHSLNEIWGSAGRRGLIGRVALYWSILTLGPLLVVLSMTGAQWLNASSATHDFVISTLGPLVAFYLIYQLMPAAPVRTLAAGAGALVAAITWQVALRGFRTYLHYAVSYGELYGSLGLLPLFLIWVWIAWLIVLAGAVTSYTAQNRNRLEAAEVRRRARPFVEPGAVAVGLVLRAARAFRAGEGPVSAEELAQATGLADELWVPLASVLEERGMLCEVGGNGERFILARPPDLLAVNDVLATVADRLVLRLDDHWQSERPQLQWLTDTLAAARRRELGDLTIAQLLDNGADKPSAGNGSAAT